jgi:hypothetical protein
MSNHEDDESEQMREHEEAAMVCRGLADQMGEFCEFITRRAGLGPAGMVTAMTVALVETTLHYSKIGQENESLENLVKGLREAHRNAMESEVAEAVEDAAQAKARGRMQ